ncbi:MAG: hypothetical protein GX490_05845 [Bacilli bacterium]|nr:hypothetical protein [Bacilli bacterium]
MEVMIDGIKVNKVDVSGIPVIYIEPDAVKEKRIALFLGGLGSTKETLVSYLKDIAKRGFLRLPLITMVMVKEVRKRVMKSLRGCLVICENTGGASLVKQLEMLVK